MVKLTINNQNIEVVEGTTVLEAAQQAEIYIPTLCHHPDVSPYGACRLCLVDINQNGKSYITTSCNCKAVDGMVVDTNTVEVQATRKVVANYILSRCPEVPAIKRLAESLGVESPGFPADDIEEDCILCNLCVRACDEIAENHVLGIVGRGADRRVTTGLSVDTTEICDACNKCVPYCPTGAITRLDEVVIGGKAKKEASRWKRARQVFQYTVLVVFLALMGFTIWNIEQPVTTNIFSRLNPLQAIASMIASRQIIWNYWPALITVCVTIWLGRVWCGWFCPLGAVFELFGFRGRRIKWQGMRYVKYVILFTILVMALFGSLAFMYFEPITIFVRGLTTAVKPVVDYIQLEDKEAFTMPGTGWWVFLSFLVFGLLVNLIERRFWCRYLCPLGALIGLGSKFSWIKRRVDQMSCVQCGDCASVCTMGAISPNNDFKSDPAECIMCMDCDPVCPKLAISFEKEKMVSWGNEFDPGRREALATLGVGAASIAMLSLDVGGIKTKKQSVLRPPGAQGDDFLDKCIRCGQCIMVCPNQVLQPGAFEAGWDSTMAPIFDPFAGGYCDYDCNRCGQICPSQAIPALTLEEKRKTVIGIAQVNFETCVRCMDCMEYCPYECFEEVEVEGIRGVFPKVIPADCVGCGICVHVCPEQETQAIVVYPADSVPEERFVTHPAT